MAEMRCRLHVRATLAIACSLLAAGCNPNHWDTQINARLPSPSGRMEALYSEDFGGGPATGVSEDVHILDTGRFPRLIDRVFTNECVHDVKLRWTDDRNLGIHYEVASDIHEDTQRATPSVWWAPWLWGSSPSGLVNVHLERLISKRPVMAALRQQVMLRR